MPSKELLDRLLEPLRGAFGPEAASRVADLRADPVVQARIEELADKCTEGQLTPAERKEYEELVSAIELIAILQAKVRANPAA